MENKEEETSEFRFETRASLPQLISQARNIVDILLKLKIDSISGSELKLLDYIQVIAKLQEEYIKQGTDDILNKITNAVSKVETIIVRSGEISNVLNIDISDCIKGQREELENLGKTLVTHFINETKVVVDKASANITNSKKIITDFAEEISDLPSELSSKIITWNPIPVLKEFIQEVNDLASKIPDQISSIISDTTDLINNLPSELMFCINDTVKKAEVETDKTVRLIAGNISIKFGESIIEYLLK